MTPLLWWMIALPGCSGTENTITALEPELVVLPETADFGDVVAGTTSTLDLTRSNDGQDVLEITGIALSDGSSGVFSFDDQPITLDVNASIPLEVSFEPVEFTTYSDALVLTWNSKDDLPTTVPLLGAGVDIDRPDIESDPSECLDFGTVAPGETSTQILRIYNTGLDDLIVTDTQLLGSGAFTFSPDLDGDVISAGGVATSLVTYAPTSADGDSSTYEITSNDPDESPFDVCLLGNGGGTGSYPVASLVCPDDSTPMSWVSFDGSASYDPGGSSLTYAWSISSAPTGSEAELGEEGLPTNNLYMDIAGDYTVSLVVTNEAGVPSAPAKCSVSAIPTEDIRVELLWSTDDSDLDLHLAEGTGDLYDVPEDVSWCNETPDWGVEGVTDDDPVKTQDDEDGYGPESIEIVDPADGEYRVRVHYYEDNGSGATKATVRIYIYGSLAEEASYTLSRNEVWEVGWIRWPYGYVILDDDPAPEIAERRSCPTD
jgi:hypothetical protein